MDPLTILKSATDIGSKVAETVVDCREKIKDGDARRMMESEELDESILSDKWSIAFDGLGAVTTAAQTISGIIKEQRDSKAQSAAAYAEIEDKHKKVEAEIESTRTSMEIAYRKAEAEIKHQAENDDHEFQIKLKNHEERLLELQKKYDYEEKKQNDSHEAEMNKMRLEHEREMEKIAIERLKAEKEADKIDAEIRQMDAAIEENKIQVQALINFMNKILDEYITMMTWEMTPENQFLVQQQQTTLLQYIPKLQALTMSTGG